MAANIAHDPVYIVTDCEFDGPTPGTHSMLSFASVAIRRSGEILGEFEAVLARLPDATTDPDTDVFWKTCPEAYAAATKNPEPPVKVMQRFIAWVRDLPGDHVFAAHPLGLDAPWIDFYLQRFTDNRVFDRKPTRLFTDAPLCLASIVVALYGKSPMELMPYPPAWLGSHAHTHRAIDDARGYAHLLAHLFAQCPDR